MKVSLIVIATGRYNRFLPDLLASAREHVRGLHKVFVLSDARPPAEDRLQWLPWGHIPWPYPTLLRYRAISAYADVMRGSDVLMYVDVDMLFTGEVDLRDAKGLISVIHPGFKDSHPDAFPFERRKISRVGVDLGQGTNYMAGGVQGGKAAAYLTACSAMARWVQDDLDRGLVPLWHDESVWNRWCIENAPSLVLDSCYCTPERQRDASSRIVALDKNHDEVRQVPVIDRARRRLRLLSRKTRAHTLRAVKRVLGA